MWLLDKTIGVFRTALFFFSSICSTCVQHAFSFLDEPSFRNKFEIPPEQVLSTSPSVSLKLLKINPRPSEKSHFLIFVFFKITQLRFNYSVHMTLGTTYIHRVFISLQSCRHSISSFSSLTGPRRISGRRPLAADIWGPRR